MLEGKYQNGANQSINSDHDMRIYKEACIAAQVGGAVIGRDIPKRSPVDEALASLELVVKNTRHDLDELVQRLLVVSTSRPTESKVVSGISSGSSCLIEERINDLAKSVAAIATDLRNARESLCI